MLQAQRAEVAQIEQQRAPGGARDRLPARPNVSSTSGSARPASAISRSSQGAVASSEPDQFSSASPGAAMIAGTLIGLTIPRVPWRTRAVPA